MRMKSTPTHHWCAGYSLRSFRNGPISPSSVSVPAVPTTRSIASATTWPCDCRASNGPLRRPTRSICGCRDSRRICRLQSRSRLRWGCRLRVTLGAGRSADGFAARTRSSSASRISTMRRSLSRNSSPRCSGSISPAARAPVRITLAAACRSQCATPHTRAAIAKLDDVLDTEAVTAAWDADLHAPAWNGPPVWIHGDLHAGNLLVDDGRLSAVIDFGGLGVGDPACDFMAAWTLFSGESRDAFRTALSIDDASWARSRGWALSTGLIALPYYLHTNPVIVAMARHQIAEVLADHKRRRLLTLASPSTGRRRRRA